MKDSCVEVVDANGVPANFDMQLLLAQRPVMHECNFTQH